MLTIPDINELIKDLNGELFPFNFIKLLWRLAQAAHAAAARAADGRRQEASPQPPREPARLHDDRVHPPRRGRRNIGATNGEFGWILEDNKGMLSIAQLPGAEVNHRYRIYEKAL